MGRRVCLAVVGCLLIAAFVAPATAQQAPRGPVVTPNVQVTTDIIPGRIHTEPQMLVHPVDPTSW